MNQIYGFRIKMVVSVVSVVHSMGIFFLFWDKKNQLWALCPYRHVIYCFEAFPENGSQSTVPTSGQIEWTDYGWLVEGKIS